jgi:hypothetical protein
MYYKIKISTFEMGLKKKYKCKRLLIAYFKNDKLYARTNLNQEEKKMFV